MSHLNQKKISEAHKEKIVEVAKMLGWNNLCWYQRGGVHARGQTPDKDNNCIFLPSKDDGNGHLWLVKEIHEFFRKRGKDLRLEIEIDEQGYIDVCYELFGPQLSANVELDINGDYPSSTLWNTVGSGSIIRGSGADLPKAHLYAAHQALLKETGQWQEVQPIQEEKKS